ncbi:MAG: PriCT-2 domain-containing protein [Neisseriaceae bacterium]|nr:PriCT-2 domain-containing protein [Neisseriaceae bacterium]
MSDMKIIEEIEKALNYIDSTERDMWVRIGSAIKSELGEDGFFIWDKWSQTASNYNYKDCQTNWKSFKVGQINIGTLFYLAKQNGYQTQKNPSFRKNDENQSNKNQLERQREQEQILKQRAKEKSQSIWDNAKAISQHIYLEQKLINTPSILNQLRQTTIKGNNLILVPVKNINGEIQSLQYINENGDKKFTSNGEIKGNFMLLGDQDKAKEEIILAEGLATAGSIYEATQRPVLVTFNAVNMISVAENLSKNNFSKNYILATDNDPSATGFKKASEAQKHLPNSKIIMPSFTQDELTRFQERFNKIPSDFNDKHLLSGVESVRRHFTFITQEKIIENHQAQIDKKEHSRNVENYYQSIPNEPNQNLTDEQPIPNEAENSINVEETSFKEEKITEPPKPKPILDLNYKIPAALTSIYRVHNGVFLDQNSNLQFKDLGNVIKTQKCDEQTIRNMIDVAQAKNWHSLKLTGSKEFKLTAWLIASERGINISGFTPNENDFKKLGNIPNSYSNSVELQAKEKIIEEKINENKDLFKIIDFGKEHKHFDPENQKTFFLQYQDKDGNNFYIWDKKIPEYMHSENLKKGDLIFEPKINKTIERNFKNDKNEVIYYEEKIWKIEKYDEIENKTPKAQMTENLTNYRVIEIGNGVDSNGEKSFFLKIEKNGDQRTLWGNHLKSQMESNGIKKGDEIAKINLINGAFNISPRVISKSKNKDTIVGQIEEKAENKNSEHRAQLNEKKFLDVEKRYTELKNQLSKHDRIITEKIENAMKDFLSRYDQDRQKEGMNALHQRFIRDYIKTNKLELPQRFLTPSTPEKNIEHQNNLSV